MGLGGQPHASAALYARGKDPVLIVQEAGWAPGPVGTSGKSHPHRIRSRTAQPVVSRYTDCATGPHRNKYILNNTKTVISGFHPWLLRNRISWVVSPCGWVIFSLYFEETYRLHVQDYEEIHGFITQKMKALRPFDTSESNYPMTRLKNPEGMLPQYENRSATNKIF